MARQLRTLIVLTVLAFGLIVGVRLLGGQGWPWGWTVGFLFVLLLQLFALVREHGDSGR